MDFREDFPRLKTVIDGDFRPHDESLDCLPHLRITLGIRRADEVKLHHRISAMVAEFAHLNFVGRLVCPTKRPWVNVLRVVVCARKFGATDRAVGPVLVEFEQLRLCYWRPLGRFLLSFEETL